MRSFTSPVFLLMILAPSFLLLSCSLIGLDDDADSPPSVQMRPPFASLAAGAGHTCAVSEFGEAYCWGDNGAGQHGNGTRISVPYPVAVDVPAPFAEIAAAGSPGDPGLTSFTCGLDQAGGAYCWGTWRHGRLGIGPRTGTAATTGAQGAPQLPRADTPHRLPAGPFRTLTIGRGHGCALDEADRLQCWGDGVMPGRIRETPDTMPGGPYGFTDIAAGGLQTCALDGAGRAFCWGSNRWGVVDVTTAGMHAEELLPKRIAPDRTFAEITVGWAHACAISDQGEAACWGRNDFGQLGTGETLPTCRGPQRNTHTCPDDPPGPRTVTGGITFASVVAGELHTCGLNFEGRVFCWGRSGRGVDQVARSSTAEPRPVDTELRFERLSAGALHTCGIASDERIYCWGSNRWGQLGTGSAEDTYEFLPQLVSGQDQAGSPYRTGR